MQVCNKFNNCTRDTKDNISSIFFAAEGEQELVTRSCGFGGVLGDSCVNIDQNGIVGKVCQCTMDNCNKDHQCKCPSGPKLNCQVCEDGGICNSTTDNGVSMECPISSNFESACWYIHEGKGLNNLGCVHYTYECIFWIPNHSVIDGEMGTFRNCGEKLPETCNILDAAGTKVTVCNCQTDNCNKDNQCDCSSNPTTQGPQTTTSSSTTTIGISALALLVSAFVLFEMK